MLKVKVIGGSAGNHVPQLLLLHQDPQNVQDIMNVQITRPVSNSNARIPAESLIQMYVAVVPTVK